MTRSPRVFPSSSISSSDRPSEKYSWSLLSLISTNGKTTIDCVGDREEAASTPRFPVGGVLGGVGADSGTAFAAILVGLKVSRWRAYPIVARIAATAVEET